MGIVQLLPKEGISFILSSTVTPPPLISESLNLSYPSLTEASDVNIQQALIINDLIFVLLGLEGNYIRYSNAFLHIVKELNVNLKEGPGATSYTDSRFQYLLNGPDFKISKSLNPSLKDVTKDIVTLGKMYFALSHFKGVFDNNFFGKVNQSFASFIRLTLEEYVQVVNGIYLNFKNDPNYSLLLMKNDLKNKNTNIKLKILHEICHLLYSDTKKRLSQNNDFLNFIDNLKKDFYSNNELDLNSDNSRLHACKGGLVLKIISQQIFKNQGNTETVLFLNQLFKEISKDYLVMLNDWLANGSVSDPFDEFLIRFNSSEASPFSTAKDQLASIVNIKSENSLGLFTNNETMESYWDTKFSIRRDGLPHELEDFNLRNKILLTGTYLNIVKDCGIMTKYIDFEKPAIFEDNAYKNSYVDDLTDVNLLNLQVDFWYMRSNKLIMELFYEGYSFLETLADFKNFYFLNDNFMSNIISGNLDILRKRRHLNLLNELQKEFQYHFSFTNTSDSNIIFKLGELTLKRDLIFTELQDIVSVKPMIPEGIFDSSSYQALKHIVNESLAPNASENSKDIAKQGPSSHVSFEDYLLNYLNFDLILPFPLNLLISQAEMIKFQLIFRFLVVNVFFQKMLEQNFAKISQFETTSHKKSMFSKKIKRLSILNFKFTSLLHKLYSNYQSVIDSNFNTGISALKPNKSESNNDPHDNLNNTLLRTLASEKHNPSQFSNNVNPLERRSRQNSDPQTLTFEETKKIIQGMLDNILFHTSLTDPKFLKLSKFFFKILINFIKFSKKFLRGVEDLERNVKGYTFISRPETNLSAASHTHNNSISGGITGPEGNNYFKEFEEYYFKFNKDFESFKTSGMS